MDKKDYKTLMEAYDEVASLSISPEGHDESESDFSREDGMEVRPADSFHDENQDLEELEDKKIQMVETHLRSIVAHAHQAISAIKKGSVIEPWMQDLIAISADNIVNTANALVYRHDVD
jgi:hypothetical protein